MNFLSSHFVIFAPVAFLLWFGLRHRPDIRIVVMITASMVFYADDHVWFIPVILVCCLVDWGVGLLLSRHRSPYILGAGVGFNLLLLSTWKYLPLLLETVQSTTGWITPETLLSVTSSWVAPLGVSFYAFSGISYMVDVYRKDAAAEPNLTRYTLFAVFFPHLVAGPILRAKDFLVDLQPGRLPMRPAAIEEGALLIARGAFKKAVVGDSIAMAIDPYFAHAGDPSTFGVWSLPYLYLYAFQIYFDFSGYTDIARGLGLLFGFRWPENFNRPYLATSIRDFWRRWHMTLSSFLRDYLYIPLGGNRHGTARKATALMATMSLGGLWHGASWSFLIWGALHGAYIVVHMLWETTALAIWLRRDGGTGWRLASMIITFHAVCLAWALFRVPDIANAVACLKSVILFDSTLMFAGGSGQSGVWLLLAGYWLAVAATVAIRDRWPLEPIEVATAALTLRRGIQWGATFGLLLITWLAAPSQSAQPFIYFQF